MTPFDNTEIAFREKSTRQLRFSILLFRMMNHPWITRLGSIIVSTLLKWHIPFVESIIGRTLFAQFCASETLEGTKDVIRALGRRGVGSILDYSVEGEEHEAAFESAVKTVQTVIEKASSDPDIPFAVFKTTGIASFHVLEKVSGCLPLSEQEAAEFRAGRHRFMTLVKHASQYDVPLMVDAEESWIQASIDEMVLEAMRQYNSKKAILYTTLQLYRTDRFAYLKELLWRAEQEGFYIGIKLVRGAYMEKERARANALGYASPVFNTKAETDAAFNETLEFIFEHRDRIALCLGSHNEESNALLVRLIQDAALRHKETHQREIAPLYFSQLYGMGDHITYNLAAGGFSVAKYVPYGPIRSVLPYLIRRAEENSAMSGHMSRELRLLYTEKERRKKAKCLKDSRA